MKRLITLILFLFPVLALGAVTGVYGKITTVLNAVTATGAGNTYQFDSQRDGPLRIHKSSMIAGAASGATATVTVEVNDNMANPWITACTLTLSSAVQSDSCVTNAPWSYMRHNVTAISAATVTDTIQE